MKKKFLLYLPSYTEDEIYFYVGIAELLEDWDYKTLKAFKSAWPNAKIYIVEEYK